MEASPQISNPLNPHTPPPAPFRSFGCILRPHRLLPFSAIQQLARRQEARGDLEFGGRGELVEEFFRERKRIGCTYRERRGGSGGRNGVVSEGLQLESVQEPLSRNSRR